MVRALYSLSDRPSYRWFANVPGFLAAMASVHLIALIFTLLPVHGTLCAEPTAGAAMAPLAASTSELPRPAAALQLQARPTKAAFPTGEEILVELTVRNVGSKPMHFFAPGQSFWRFVNLTLDRKPMRRADYRQDWDIREAKEHFVTIDPGKTWTTTLSVSRCWDPAPPLTSGRMQMTYANGTKNGRSIGIDGWTGTLESNEFDLVLR